MTEGNTGLKDKSMETEQKSERKKNAAGWRKFWTAVFFAFFLIVLLLLNFTAYRLNNVQVSMSHIPGGALTVIPFRNIAFMLICVVLLAISCFTSLQLCEYKTGKLFAAYTILTTLSIGIAPCTALNDSLISVLRFGLSCVGSVLLFRVVGYLTLQKEKKLYLFLQGVLVLIGILGTVLKIITLFPLPWNRLYLYAGDADKISISSSVLSCLILMVTNYNKSNIYTKKQMRILIFGLGIGGLLFWMAYTLPELLIVQNVPTEEEVFVELESGVANTIDEAFPLLLFAGISISIILVLLRREFSVADTRLKLGHFIFAACYTAVTSLILFVYGSLPMWTIALVLVVLTAPFLYGCWTIYVSQQELTEQTYEHRLLAEVEKEKQELSVYLHDDVLQSLIAFYRKVRADKSGQYDEMETALSELITGVRKVSHNLYPTIVEDLGLEQSLTVCIAELQNDYPELAFDYQYHFRDGILPKTLALTAYRAAKELLTNAAKHSGGTQVRLLLEEDTTGYFVYVSDNGKGLSGRDSKASMESSHMGLYTVKKQVSAIGGRMDAKWGSGANFKIYFPKED